MRRLLALLLILILNAELIGSTAASIPHLGFSLPEGQLGQWANLAGGVIRNNAALITAGNDLTLSAAAFQNLKVTG